MTSTCFSLKPKAFSPKWLIRSRCPFIICWANTPAEWRVYRRSAAMIRYMVSIAIICAAGVCFASFAASEATSSSNYLLIIPYSLLCTEKVFIFFLSLSFVFFLAPTIAH